MPVSPSERNADKLGLNPIDRIAEFPAAEQAAALGTIAARDTVRIDRKGLAGTDQHTLPELIARDV
jgi:hypothetical protein